MNPIPAHFSDPDEKINTQCKFYDWHFHEQSATETLCAWILPKVHRHFPKFMVEFEVSSLLGCKFHSAERKQFYELKPKFREARYSSWLALLVKAYATNKYRKLPSENTSKILRHGTRGSSAFRALSQSKYTLNPGLEASADLCCGELLWNWGTSLTLWIERPPPDFSEVYNRILLEKDKHPFFRQRNDNHRFSETEGSLKFAPPRNA